ncbi:hypothetical protein HAHE_37270 [Haloferula helveola]|uniref:Prepilin-type N-terminal cleavage/methylation domain-containing protein n=1 Tax=Haloferula helveola TaxID=490095 RepID=A0ABM7RDT1_9BACT|nr:hypothetical protein HAHE_37270 [Haloferula helveola]
MKHRFSRRPASSGFTLIELLVVIVIVAALSSLVFVVARRGLEKARAATCASNLRQVGMLMNGYASENFGQYPHGGPPDGWIDRLCVEMVSGYPENGGNAEKQTYFESGGGEIFNCPSDKDGRKNLHKSYLANPRVVGMKTGDGDWLGNGAFSPQRQQALKYPARTFLVIEDWGRNSKLWKGNGLRYEGDIKKDAERPCHGDGRHFLYVDGHVEFMTQDPGAEGDGFDIYYKGE